MRICWRCGMSFDDTAETTAKVLCNDCALARRAGTLTGTVEELDRRQAEQYLTEAGYRVTDVEGDAGRAKRPGMKVNELIEKLKKVVELDPTAHVTVVNDGAWFDVDHVRYSPKGEAAEDNGIVWLSIVADCLGVGIG